VFSTSWVTLNMNLSSTAMVRRKISPLPLSQTSVTGLPTPSVSPLSTCQGVSAPGTSSKLSSPAGAQP
jgi:hypothetical protein